MYNVMCESSLPGIIMSLHLFTASSESAPSLATSDRHLDELRLLCAYENGGVTLWRYTKPERQVSIEGIGWERIWSSKLHAETGVCGRCSIPGSSFTSEQLWQWLSQRTIRWL
jgi:hypothetical protein